MQGSRNCVPNYFCQHRYKDDLMDEEQWCGMFASFGIQWDVVLSALSQEEKNDSRS